MIFCELPNTKDQYRKRELKKLNSADHTKYYLSQLVMETRIFTREMIYRCGITESDELLFGNTDLEGLFKMIELHRLEFFKYLLLNDIKGLEKGRLVDEVRNAKSVEEIQMHLKKYARYRNLLFEKLNKHYLKLKNIYCQD